MGTESKELRWAQLRDDICELAKEGLSHREIARRLNCASSSVSKWLARRGHAPEFDMTHAVPDGFIARGVSSYYNAEGKLTGQWVKSSIDDERWAEIIREMHAAMIEELPKLKRRKAPKSFDKNLMAAYPIGDAHHGMLAWHEETGDDYDLKISERVHCEAMDALVQRAPPTETALIVDVGDYQHADNRAGITTRGGNILDMDGRYPKMARVSLKVMRQCIESALAKHKSVRVIIAPGNHNDVGATWMALALSHVYENEPRVSVDTTPARFMYHSFGKVLIGVHHGDTCKLEKLPGVMATDKAAEWGAALHRYWLTGHVHHQQVIEFPGVVVETFNTLAPKDAHATEAGYRARQNMKAIVYHAEHGEVARWTVNPQMLT